MMAASSDRPWAITLSIGTPRDLYSLFDPISSDA
jgi:hypothetical protein